MNRDHHLGVIAAFAAGILWSFLGPAVRLCTDIGLSTVQMTWLRYITVVIVMASYVLIFRRECLKVNRFELLLMVVMAVVGVMLNSTLYFESMLLVSLSLATVLQYLSPFVVVAFSVPLFHENLTRNKVIAVSMAFIGCILCTGLISSPGEMNSLGITLGAISGFCYGTYVLCSKRLAQNGISSTTILFYTSIMCFIGLGPLCDAPDALSIMTESVESLLLIVLLGLFLTLAPFWLFNYSLEKIEAGKASIISFVEPLVASIIGFSIYGEILTVEAMIGMAMIMLALIIINRIDDPEGSEDPAGSE
ncbi:MAG: DMT family transporter [Thermoplasmata archaeon]|nr:DMT family transporter [Thermoplasmata archaeon]